MQLQLRLITRTLKWLFEMTKISAGKGFKEIDLREEQMEKSLTDKMLSHVSLLFVQT